MNETRHKWLWVHLAECEYWPRVLGNLGLVDALILLADLRRARLVSGVTFR